MQFPRFAGGGAWFRPSEKKKHLHFSLVKCQALFGNFWQRFSARDFLEHTIISPDAVESIGITIEDDDMLVTSYGVGGKQFAFVKMVDKIKFNTFTVEECYIDFGVIDMDGKINGLLGLDLLMKAGVIIDMKNLLLYEGI